MATKPFPDLSDLFAKREAGRKQRARMSFAAKLKVLDELKAGAEPFRAAREKSGSPLRTRRGTLAMPLRDMMR